ncbi:hypothetical protein HELRODRAFT_170144 [Helobdella robusta]|uniref:Uncharacterized protein n=1 Tax=Helobdella robusta TaxID=6412 RepID=T1F2P9_HELRO|nr:hypothetical protein HELRODRAFT_170144 [Helobdella robusta]ESO07599.1 hypothetical protein HELRODRAFT_170144 [Helobdella robusta]
MVSWILKHYIHQPSFQPVFETSATNLLVHLQWIGQRGISNININGSNSAIDHGSPSPVASHQSTPSPIPMAAMLDKSMLMTRHPLFPIPRHFTVIQQQQQQLVLQQQKQQSLSRGRDVPPVPLPFILPTLPPQLFGQPIHLTEHSSSGYTIPSTSPSKKQQQQQHSSKSLKDNVFVFTGRLVDSRGTGAAVVMGCLVVSSLAEVVACVGAGELHGLLSASRGHVVCIDNLINLNSGIAVPCCTLVLVSSPTTLISSSQLCHSNSFSLCVWFNCTFVFTLNFSLCLKLEQNFDEFL